MQKRFMVDHSRREYSDHSSENRIDVEVHDISESDHTALVLAVRKTVSDFLDYLEK